MNESFLAQLIFTSSAFSAERLQQGLQKWRDLGHHIELGTPPAKAHRFYCGTRQQRAQSVLDALANDRAKVLVPPRGGYGCIELLDHLDLNDQQWRDKTVLGFSDLTAFHAALSNHGLRSVHGPMLATQDWLDADAREIDSLQKALGEKPYHIPLKAGRLPEHKLRGRLVGGNLSVLASLMGTPHQLKLQANDLLFLEDINEAPYSLARSLFQLSHSPHFSSCTIIWGHLTSCQLDSASLTAELMSDHSNPWLRDCPAGHERPNHSLPLGSIAELHLSDLSLRFT